MRRKGLVICWRRCTTLRPLADGAQRDALATVAPRRIAAGRAPHDNGIATEHVEKQIAVFERRLDQAR